MSTLITFASSHGSTEKAATMLADLLQDDVSIVNLKNKNSFKLADFNTVIIGGSIHAGKIQRKVKNFCIDNSKELLQKKIGLFLCCMEEGDAAQKQFDDGFPLEMRNHASVTGLFGGEFNFDKMNFIQKAIIKKISGTTESVSKLKKENINTFAAELNK